MISLHSNLHQFSSPRHGRPFSQFLTSSLPIPCDPCDPNKACGGLRLAAVGLPHEAEAPLLQKRPATAGRGGSPAAAGAAVDQKGGTRAQPGHRQGANGGFAQRGERGRCG